jgi:antitoxin (DNA-binding transcriptional repressor) of toxin-antitoxin stability system
MAEPATPRQPVRLEMSINEARTRFLQLVRLTGLTRQTTVIVDHGRPIAAVVPLDQADRPAPPPVAAASAAGWERRLQTVRTDLQRQHAGRTGELVHALDEAWRLLDSLRPPGSDRAVDTLRTMHAELRRRD